MYVLDTNTLIYFFRGQGQVADTLLSISPSEVGVPAVVVFELETGLAKSESPQQRRRQLDAMLDAIHILPFGRTEAREAADIRAALERSGTPIGPLDTLIAGTARASGSILVTRNMREFSRVPGLRVEDWYGA